ncbi:hypothetical protein MNBD_ALPHA12-2236, partial [hydrothermal vent metagenome]
GFSFVIPAQAGIQSFLCHLHTKRWTPVFTGVTLRGFVYYFALPQAFMVSPHSELVELRTTKAQSEAIQSKP